ncbi:hypothetical protein [Haloarchaeobius iranensis]|uniref:PGF-CTERM protein n=1 Tax=Haloarchaeobius iranensis TaxID=996166 RepID=A0A1G9TAM2_9EURY|nr:hypothetical protein [Haloarchaeobius iranensis]SDM44717.1 hypothetical protein SAMN05192554_102237 [Haloarchaeobius iranensis]
MEGTRVCIAFLVFVATLSGTVTAVPTDRTGSTNHLGAASPAPYDEQVGVVASVAVDRTPADLGAVRVTLTFEFGRDLGRLRISTHGEPTVVDRSGIVQGYGEETLYRWDGETPDPSITVEIPTNETNEQFGGLDFVETADWALFEYFATARYYSTETQSWHEMYESGDRFRTRTSFAPDFAVGDTIAFAGAYEHYNASVGGRTVTLIVPNDADLAADPERITGSITHAMRALDVGGDTGDVHAFAAPEPIRGGGLHPGGSDIWASRGSTVDGPGNTWVHEYVHVQQGYTTTPETSWFTEASADYYASLLAYRRGATDFSSFHSSVSLDQDADAVLAESHEEGVGYTKGARVLAALDAEIRERSDDRYSLADVFYLMNSQPERVDYETFRSYVQLVGGAELGSWLDEYVLTSAVPTVPREPALFTTPAPTTLDSDDDGLTDAEEHAARTDPFSNDSDEDGLTDEREVEGLGTDPTAADTDGDGLTDDEELAGRSDPTLVDTDDDGLSDRSEARVGSDPTAADTDGDGLTDETEAHESDTDPTAVDTDDDGLSDGTEFDGATDPQEADTDGDGLDDGAEVNQHGTDPTAVDTDGDGLDDGTEVNQHGTDPTAVDTDGDGVDDPTELDEGTDPVVAETATQTRATDTSTADDSGASTPGFGVAGALVALVACLVVFGRGGR